MGSGSSVQSAPIQFDLAENIQDQSLRNDRDSFRLKKNDSISNIRSSLVLDLPYMKRLTNNISNQIMKMAPTNTRQRTITYGGGYHENSGRISMASNTSKGSKSVRAMALMNHSRQENSYIPQDKLSISLRRTTNFPPSSPNAQLHLSRRLAASANNSINSQLEIKEYSVRNYPPDFLPEAIPEESEKKELASIHVTSERAEIKASDNDNLPLSDVNEKDSNESEQPNPVGFLRTSTLSKLGLGPKLTIKVNDDPDWIPVDEGEENDNMSDDGLQLRFEKFDDHRIKLPFDETENESSKTDEFSNVPINYKVEPVPSDDKAGKIHSMSRDKLQSASKMQSSSASTKQSRQYSFNQKGTIFVEGFKGGVISANGIIKNDPIGSQESLDDNSVTALSEPSNTVTLPKTVSNKKSFARPNKKLSMKERLIVICKLGQGASSVVYKALDVMEMRLVALKMIHVHEKEKRSQLVKELSALFQLIRENSRRESAQLPKFRRPEKYIVDFYDAFSNLEDGIVALMMEYMDGGSLQDIVDHGGCDDEVALVNIAVQALKGLDFLHNCDQLHRDLKPGNFLISHRGEVKVADLGIMKQFNSKSGNSSSTVATTSGNFISSLRIGSGRVGNGQTLQRTLPKATTFVGTATYMSPERIDGKEYSYPSDIWAFGLSIISVALGRLPIETQGGYWTILHSIRDAPPPTLPADRFSKELRDFVDLCMKRKPEERPTCKQLLRHPFLKKARPEDLTYAQSYNRGKSELHSIIRALLMHIRQLKEESSQNGGRDPSSFDVHAIQNVFGDIQNSDDITILRRVLFGPQEIVDRQEVSTAASPIPNKLADSEGQPVSPSNRESSDIVAPLSSSINGNGSSSNGNTPVFKRNTSKFLPSILNRNISNLNTTTESSKLNSSSSTVVEASSWNITNSLLDPKFRLSKRGKLYLETNSIKSSSAELNLLDIEKDKSKSEDNNSLTNDNMTHESLVLTPVHHKPTPLSQKEVTPTAATESSSSSSSNQLDKQQPVLSKPIPFTKPRLQILARQLHLPPDFVAYEAREFCDLLARQVDVSHHHNKFSKLNFRTNE